MASITASRGTGRQPAAATAPRPRPKQQQRRGIWFWCYVFMLPAAVLGALFTFYPMVMSWVISFMDWNGFTAHGTFIGLANYRELIGDSMFWQAFGRSMIFMVVGTPIRVVLSLLVAIALNSQIVRCRPAIRTFFFLPVITTAAVVGVVMSFVLGSYQGPVNTLLMALHLTDSPIEFLADPRTAIWSVVGVQIWKNFGMTMIYWLAALQTVPAELYDAARVDGASRIAVLRHITVPLLLPFALVIIVLTAKENLHAFALVQSMTAGGPFFSTQVIEVYIYQTAFAAGETGGQPRLGYASAAGCFFGVVTLVIAVFQLYAVKRVNDLRGQLGKGRAA
ncbi:multiple sugar transport system permease protein [Kribbella aluminosa]|uniref:Multiple sugar transport system permease protein n=1 Tax=Kribbella aluminosa TaxID=416017 RepID=A0ABS4UWS9_9ACTN|nr:sugar ABC transporter permease [Kribbella aluminosa]MBP2356087.1 multiple sugar transport system permease protein [Kribbella aluminosa]